jgi:EpsI family protein
MPGFSKRYLITVLLLIVTAFISFGAYSTVTRSSVLYTKNIPMIIGNWYGNDIPIEERTYEVLETKDVLMREYKNPEGENVLLTIVYAQNNRKVAHPPEVCFEGSGWSRTNKETQVFSIGNRSLEFNKLTIQKGNEMQLVLYLYKSGDKFTPDYYSQQVNNIFNSILHKKTSSALIRITTSHKDDIQASTNLISSFIGDVIPILEKSLNNTSFSVVGVGK